MKRCALVVCGFLVAFAGSAQGQSGAVGPSSVFQMSTASLDVRETAGTSEIRVRRTGSITGGATVTFEAVSGTATSTVDFVLTAGELVFAEGELEKTIPVTLIQDGSVEGDEHFEVRLTGVPGGGQLGSVVATTVTIVDSNDAGSLDDTFQPVMAGANRSVHSLLVQNDGKVVVGGHDLGATGGRSLIRLNPDGSIDSTFQASSQAPMLVYAIASQPDGKLVVGGSMSPSPYLTRIAKVVRFQADRKSVV